MTKEKRYVAPQIKQDSKIALILNASFGELDVLLPIMRIYHGCTFVTIITNHNIKKQLDTDAFYRHILEEHSKVVDLSASDIPRNFITRWIIFVTRALKVLFYAKGCDLFFLEYGGSGGIKTILVILLSLLGRGRDIVYHPHGHAVNSRSDYYQKRPLLKNLEQFSRPFGSKCLMIFESNDDKKNEISVPYPILSAQWRSYILSQTHPLFEGHVVILGRDSHDIYLTAENRRRMINDIIEAVNRFFPNAQIVYKLHPRESEQDEAILVNPMIVTRENTYRVVFGAELVISFWTSAFFQCLALNVPVIEYYIPHNKFTEAFPDGSLNSKFVESFSEKESLFKYIAQFVKYE